MARGSSKRAVSASSSLALSSANSVSSTSLQNISNASDHSSHAADQSPLSATLAVGMGNSRPQTPTKEDSANHESSLESQSGSKYNDSSSLSRSLSLLSPHPFIDSLTIFVLILQFPNLIVSFMHLLFSCLTFAPVTALSGSPSLISSLTHGTPSSPNLLTILFADIAVAVVSIFFLPRLRSVIVDLGSAIIASTLGGGATKTAVYCTSLLQFLRIVKHSLFLLRRDALPPISTTPPYTTPDPIPENLPTPQYYLATGSSGIPRVWDFLSGSAGWFGQAIAVHIVGQSMLYSFRRMFLEHNNRLSSMPAASSAPEILGENFDCEAATYSGIQSAPFPASIPPKKKKKSLNAGRHQQPSLWTALANMLVLASREASDLRVVPSKQPVENHSLLSSLISEDSSANGLGYRPSDTEPALYSCVRYILENEVAFEITPGQRQSPSEHSSAPAEASAHLSLSVPSVLSHSDVRDDQSSVYNGVSVRVNGILWPEVSVQTIVPKVRHHDSDADPTVQLLEDAVADEPGTDLVLHDSDEFSETLLVVSGLTPITEYEIEVCKKFPSGRQVTICRTTICTSPKDLSSQQQQPSRPLSPVTTLLDTLCTTNAMLTDEKQKLKRSRRDHSKHLSALRSEIDSLKSRLAAGDKGDERAWRRVLALREAVRRTEEEIETFNIQIEELAREEKTVNDEIESHRASWREKMEELRAAEAQFREAQDKIERKERGLNTDESVVQTRRDKLAARHKKLMLDFQRADLERRAIWENEFARRKVQRDQLTERRKAIEAEFSNAITKMEKGIDDIKERTNNAWQSASLLSEAAATISPTNSNNLETASTSSLPSF